MASTPFTLAALATLAVPGLVVHSAREHSFGDADELIAAVLTTDLGELIVRVPRDATAEQILGGELLSLNALTDGARSVLPFEVPRVLGQTQAGQTRAAVFTFLSGSKMKSGKIASDALVLASVAATLRSIHTLPQALVHDAGLPIWSATESRENAARVVQRANATRLLPASVEHRWNEVLEDVSLWEFEPTVTHGNLSVDQLLVHNEHVTGVLGWSTLAVDDPARDFAWLVASGEDTFEAVVSLYRQSRDISDLNAFRARAHFLHELELAKWLLHGVDTHDQEIIDDAIMMFDALVDRLSIAPSAIPRQESLSVEEVSSLLTPVEEAITEPIEIISTPDGTQPPTSPNA